MIFLQFIILFFIFSPQLSYAKSSRVLEKDEIVNINSLNSIALKKGTKISYHENGHIHHIFTTSYPLEVTQWLTQAGEQYPLFCGVNAFDSTGSNGYALISFYPSGEYNRGCHASRTFPITIGHLNLVISLGSELQLFPDGKPAYIKSVMEGSVSVKNNSFQIKPRSEVQLHKNGEIYVFTPLAQQSIQSLSPIEGLYITQISPEKAIYLFNNGYISQANLAKNYLVDDISLPEGSQVAFNNDQENLYIWGALLPDSVIITSLEGYSLKTKNIKFNENSVLEGLEVENNFEFTNPESQKNIPVEAGDLVYLDEKRKITKIEFRVAR